MLKCVLLASAAYCIISDQIMPTDSDTRQCHMLKCVLLTSAAYSVINDKIIPTDSDTCWSVFCWCQQLTVLSVIKSYLPTVTHAEVCFAGVSSLHCYQWSDHTYRHLHMLKCVLLVSAVYCVESDQIIPTDSDTCWSVFCWCQQLTLLSVIRSYLPTVTHVEVCFADNVSSLLCYQ